MSQDPINNSRLLWRCRRGIREMDLLLENFMEYHYLDLPETDKQVFETFLDETDPDIMNWITGRTTPGNNRYETIIRILQTMNRET